MKNFLGKRGISTLPIAWRDEQWCLSLGRGCRTERRHVAAVPAQRLERENTCRGMRSRHGRAFTLIELLVVMGIIAVLAGLLIPAVAVARKKAKITLVKTEASNLAGYIAAYQADYTIAPTSTNRAARAATTPEAQLSITSSNREVMYILLAEPTNPALDPRDPNGSNPNNARNPQKRSYAGAVRQAKGPAGPGLTPNFDLNDAWGNPFIISLDLNYDNRVEDPLYGRVPGSVLVWSAGPDGKFDLTKPADQDVNKDNVLHWK